MEQHGDTTLLQIQAAVRHSKYHCTQAQCKLMALIAHHTHTIFSHPISYTYRHTSLSCCTTPSWPNLFIFLRYGLSLLTKVIAHFLLHPSLPSAHGALNRKADASLGMSAGVCPNEAGVKSLPSASLPCSYRLSSVSNMLDMFLFSVKKKSNLFSNYKRI